MKQLQKTANLIIAAVIIGGICFSCYAFALVDSLSVAASKSVSVFGGVLLLAIAAYWLTRLSRGRIDRTRFSTTVITESERATQSALESEQRFSTIFHASSAAYAITTQSDGRIIDINDSFSRITGYEREEAVGRTTLELNLWVDPGQRSQMVQAVDRDRLIRNAEYEYRRKTGEIFTGLISCEEITLGQASCLLTVVIDITERKRSEEALRLDESRLEVLLKLHGMVDAPLQEITDYTLENAVRLTKSEIGYLAFISEDEMVIKMHVWSKNALRQSDLENKPGTYYLRDTGIWSEAVRQRKPVITNDCQVSDPNRIGYPAGHGPISRQMSVPVFYSDKIVAVAGVANKSESYDQADVRQITLLMQGMWRQIQHKRDLEALRESEQKFRGISMSAQDAIVMMDERGCISFWNSAAEKTFGYNDAEAIGMNLHKLLAPKRFHSDHLAAFQKFRKSGHGAALGRIVELAALRKDGTEFPVELSLAPIRQRNTWHAVGIIRDITERKQTEEVLQKAKNVAEAANSAKSEFLANMSHEIRTPMTAILGFAEEMLDPTLSDEQKCSAAHTIRRNGEHLIQIINDILDLSKVEAGRLDIECVDCSPIKIITDVWSLMQVRVDAKGLAFKVEYESPIPESIKCDPTRLRQILVNLIGNAVKFTMTGEIRLVVRVVPCEPVSDSFAGSHTRLQFDVIDTGIGMTQEQVNCLFQPFTQADSSTSRKFGGTGLGLSISKRLAEKLGGTIAVVESRAHEGSRFRLTIDVGRLDAVRMIEDPAKEMLCVPESTARYRETNGTCLADTRILLAEDGIDNQRLIVRVLSKAGAEVRVAENGRQAADLALAALRDNRAYDAILMDMQMPVMDGYEATEHLRRSGYTAPIIAITAHSMASDREKCLKVGCDEYATKPIDRARLIETIKQQILQFTSDQKVS